MREARSACPRAASHRQAIWSRCISPQLSACAEHLPARDARADADRSRNAERNEKFTPDSIQRVANCAFLFGVTGQIPRQFEQPSTKGCPSCNQGNRHIPESKLSSQQILL